MITKRIITDTEYFCFNANEGGIYLEINFIDCENAHAKNTFISNLDELKELKKEINKAINYQLKNK